MANTKSAKKQVKVIARRELRNQATRSAVKTLLKKAHVAVATGKNAEQAVAAAVSLVDSAASKGIIHKNKAARQKSRLARKAKAKA